MSRSSRRTARTAAALLVSLALVTTACSSEPDDEPDASEPTSEPTESPETPDEPEETEEPGGPTEVVGTIAEGLRAPWGLDFLPDGSALVTERDTKRVVHVRERSGGNGWRVDEVAVIDEAAPYVEGGLLGVAVSPTYEEDNQIFLYVTASGDNRVLRGEFVDGDLRDLTPILTGIPKGPTHDGGRILFGPDDHLYVATGDAGDRDLSQDPDSLAGKILRITPDGEPVADNPDSDSPVYSLGHRNVQGLTFDDEGQLWASEFGEDRFDELNRIEAGANYGWPMLEGLAEDNPGQGGDDLVDPVAVWPTDDASPSGLAWADGSLWMAALRGSRLWQATPDGDDAETQAHFVGEYGRLRTVVTAPDGTLWVTTSNHDGRGDPAGNDDRILQVRP